MSMSRVLVVDDDETVRLALRSMLELEDYEVEEACDGREALLVLLEADRSMVVLLDLRMPTVSGDQLLRVVLHHPDLRQRHAYIVHTANAENMPAAIRDLLDYLGVPVIAKPFDLDTVLHAVEKAEHRLAASTEDGRTLDAQYA